MAIVSEEVTHILFHVDAETSAADPSQKPGFNIRGDQVNVMVAPLRNNDDDVTRVELLELFRQRVDGPPGPSVPELLDEINLIIPDGTAEKIRSALQAWVGKGPRPGRDL